MTTNGDIAVGIVAVLGAFALCANVGYQFGYDAARDECKPIRTEIPFKQMTHKQQVRWIQWANRDRGIVK